ncbi:MAG: family 78 glycoside hydrolase catalytic domain [Cellvibrio sp.]|uniref:family 78 glycoside hydrolase catalytic domain n=1 Tax=Cellvibrio sp. TaxID=1965322 RepID=UPI002719C51A|nr:family 78 glycoside hydrolase catalytic domain [Cellvibrio sp.]
MRVIFAILLFCVLGTNVLANSPLTDLRVDYETRPLVLESTAPDFSWRMPNDTQSVSQAAYAIEVKAESGESVWQSGKIISSDSLGIRYSGKPLSPITKYNWTVNIWDEKGRQIKGESWFETGFMAANTKAWSDAKWIGGSADDLVLWSDYLTVFQLSVDVQLDKSVKAERAAFLYGGNDPRLRNKTYNTHSQVNNKDESYIALELDISQLIRKKGRAKLNIFRVGYSKTDRKNVPLISLPIADKVINSNNMYEPHTINIESVFGSVNVFVNSTPVSSSHGINLNPLAFAGSLEVKGGSGDYVAFPALANIGFWVKEKQSAYFSKIQVRNNRSPSNILFSAGQKQKTAHGEIFVTEKNANIRKTVWGAYHVSTTNKPFIVLADPSRLSAPMLRTEFELNQKKIKKARIYATARGIYEMYLNGRRVGDDYFTPGLTQYNKHHAYQAYDVTNLLREGEANAMGVWLSEGWWSGNSSYSGINWNYFGDRQSVLAKLLVTYDDDSTTEINTNPDTWSVFHGGPIRYGSFFQGEIYDARLEHNISGWASPKFDATSWAKASEVTLEQSAFIAQKNHNPNTNELITDYKSVNLIGHQGDNPRVVNTLQAKSVAEVRPGVFVYDMGQNMVGFPQITLNDSTSGERIVIRYSEVKYPDLPKYKKEGLTGMLMTENFRAAMVQDIFYAKGGKDIIQPRFTFHGYRFLEITGIDRALPLASVQGKVISSVSNLTAGYETSNPLVNKLWENITWSMRGNFLSIPTDTPARNERMGWNGDLNVFVRTATYLSDVDPFLRRHMTAMRDIQGDNGRFTDVAPMGAGGFGGTLWGSAGITAPWIMYQQYGDMSSLKTNYPAMKRYTDYLWSKINPTTGILIDGPLGDWLSPEANKNDNTLLWEAYHLYILDVMAKTANLIGAETDRALFTLRHKERKEFFNRVYVDKNSGKTILSGMMTGWGVPFSQEGKVLPERKGTLIDSQASYAIPLAMNAFDEKNIPLAKMHLAETVARENVDDSGIKRPACSLMTGFIGTAALMPALSQAKRADLAYCLLQQQSYPSWLYSVVNGSTTIWERLNSYTVNDGFGDNNGMNSFNHYSFGSVGAWMISDSLGIQQDENIPGYKHFIFRPTPDPTGKMTWAKGFYDSNYGRIKSGWEISANTTTYNLVVPANTSATLFLKTGSENLVSEKANAGAIRFIKFTNGETIYELTPGSFSFKVRN